MSNDFTEEAAGNFGSVTKGGIIILRRQKDVRKDNSQAGKHQQ